MLTQSAIGTQRLARELTRRRKRVGRYRNRASFNLHRQRVRLAAIQAELEALAREKWDRELAAAASAPVAVKTQDAAVRAKPSLVQRVMRAITRGRRSR